MPQERLQKLIARAGLASRRAAERLILAGRVRVNGRVVTTLGTKADPDRDRIEVNGRPLPAEQRREYWLVHKPRGVLSTARDPHGRRTVLDLLPEGVGRLYPVGRLDHDSEGLMLLTNDGELAQRLAHPRHHVPKTYKVWVQGRPDRAAIERLRRGVKLEDGVTAPARVYLKASSEQTSKLSMVLNQGKKRQIRRMCEAVGHPVRRLVRVGLGPLRLGDLPPGAARRLTPGELAALRRAAGPISGCKPGGHGVNSVTRPRGGRGTRHRQEDGGR